MSRLEEAAVNSGKRIIGSIAPMAGLSYQETKFFWNFPQLARESARQLCADDETIAVINTGVTFAGPQRNESCRRMWGDWLFMVDADMLQPMDTLPLLLQRQQEVEARHGECGVIVGVYPKREMPPGDILIYNVNPQTGLWDSFDPGQLSWDEPGRCDAAGAGCMLVMRNTVERIVMEFNVPPFLWWGPLKRKMHEPLGAETEDLAFCRRLQMLDPPIQLWYTTDVTPTHLTQVQVGLKDWLAARKVQGGQQLKATADSVS